MLDPSQRTIKYLRLSITKACAMRCVYCRPETATNFSCGDQLSTDEIVVLVEHLVMLHGLRKVRLTGGEPTSRPDLLEIVRRLSAIPALRELALTTNGLTLVRDAGALAAAGLQRVNISIDSLDASRFFRVTGVDALSRVKAGIDAAIAAGLSPVKLNTVVLREQNLNELPELLHFAAEKQVEIRFIELMPMGPLAGEWTQNYVPEFEMRQRLDTYVTDWQPMSRDNDASLSYRVKLVSGSIAKVGFITP